MNKILNYLIKWMIEHKLLTFKGICSLRYFLKFKKMPNFKNPQTINEKLLWLEFNTDTSEWTRLSDKYRVREYLHEKNLDELCVKLYGMYEDPKDIDFDALPDSFVIKTNNGYGSVLLIKDKNKINREEIVAKLSKWLKEPFGYLTGEPHYTRIKPCVIIEELMKADKSLSSSLIDYKFWCLNGEPVFCFVCSNRSIEHHTADFNAYTLPNWERKDDWMFGSFKNSCKDVPCPSNLEEMLEYTRVLSRDFPLVRVDLYNVNGKVYFGEMTFTSNGGRMRYYTDEVLLELGQKLKIDTDKK